MSQVGVDEAHTCLAVNKVIGVGGLVGKVREAESEGARLNELVTSAETAVRDTDLDICVRKNLDLWHPAVNEENVSVVVLWEGNIVALGCLEGPNYSDFTVHFLSQLQASLVDRVDVPLLPVDE